MDSLVPMEILALKLTLYTIPSKWLTSHGIRGQVVFGGKDPLGYGKWGPTSKAVGQDDKTTDASGLVELLITSAPSRDYGKRGPVS